MAVTLNLTNFTTLNISPETANLDADVTKGATTFSIQNVQNIAANDYLILGTLGSELAEMVQVGSISGSTVTIAAAGVTKLAHVRYDIVTKLFGNQLKIYRGADNNGFPPADTSFTSIGTVAIDVDQPLTPYTDASGTSSNWYKYTYYNSTNLAETNIGDATAGRGQQGSYCSTDSIREKSGFTGVRFITETMIDAKRQAAQSEINGKLAGFYALPFAAPISPFIADITARLAAGLLLLDQYGSYGTQNTQNGKSKVDMARADIESIKSGANDVLDANGSSLRLDAGTITGVGGAGWPNNETPVDQEFVNGYPLAGSGDFKFRVNDRY